jgi:hypothetical protein
LNNDLAAANATGRLKKKVPALLAPSDGHGLFRQNRADGWRQVSPARNIQQALGLWKAKAIQKSHANI